MKRFLKGFSLTALVALVLTLGACDITELNDNPNESTSVTTGNLLANAQNYLATTYWQDYPGGFWVRYAQYWTTNQYTESDRYQYPSRRAGSNNNVWSRFYLALNDLEEIARIARNRPSDVEAFGPPKNQIAISMIMQAFTFHMMTDIWGPIPYDEALKGRTQGDFRPAYTPQPEVYQGLIDSLTKASNMIVEGEPTLASSDVVYGGDMSQWKKLANSLKMRVAMRAVDVGLPEGEVETAIQEAIQAGVMTEVNDAALIPFSSAPPYQNPYYENYEVEGRDDWAAPEPILGLMNDVQDPRRESYFTDAYPDEEGNQFNPFPYGLPRSEAVALFTAADQEFSRPSERVRGEAGAPAFIMLYDEVLFLKAEAAERGFISGDPSQLYEEAIQASFDFWDAGDAAEYISRVPYDNSTGWLPEITASGANTPTDVNDNPVWEHTLGIQKWLALYLQGIQGWSEWRRLDFQEVLAVPPGNPGAEAFNCTFPLRMEYPLDETAVNQANLETAVNDYLGGEDTQGVGLWWDVRVPSCSGN